MIETVKPTIKTVEPCELEQDLYADRAPGFVPSAVGKPLFQRAVAQGIGYMLPNIFFVIFPFIAVVNELNTGDIIIYTALVCCLIFFFLGAAIAVEWGLRARIIWFLLLLLSSNAISLLGEHGIATIGYTTTYVCAVAAMLFRPVAARVLVVLSAGTAFLLGLNVHYSFPAIVGVSGGFLGFYLSFTYQKTKTERRLQQMRERVAQLAVSAERERIGRDLHDILGHSLTTIAIKTDLAARLVDVDAAAAKAEIQDVSQVARAALSDVRATASGLQKVRLVGEIATSRSILQAAGITAETPSALPSFADADSEVLGYVVREAVTNVLRHSGASVCRIFADESGVSVSDNGAGLSAGAEFSGLAGLRARCEEAGWELSIENLDGVCVRATKSESGTAKSKDGKRI